MRLCCLSSISIGPQSSTTFFSVPLIYGYSGLPLLVGLNFSPLSHSDPKLHLKRVKVLEGGPKKAAIFISSYHDYLFVAYPTRPCFRDREHGTVVSQHRNLRGDYFDCTILTSDHERVAVATTTGRVELYEISHDERGLPSFRPYREGAPTSHKMPVKLCSFRWKDRLFCAYGK